MVRRCCPMVPWQTPRRSHPSPVPENLLLVGPIEPRDLAAHELECARSDLIPIVGVPVSRRSTSWCGPRGSRSIPRTDMTRDLVGAVWQTLKVGFVMAGCHANTGIAPPIKRTASRKAEPQPVQPSRCFPSLPMTPAPSYVKARRLPDPKPINRSRNSTTLSSVAKPSRLTQFPGLLSILPAPLNSQHQEAIRFLLLNRGLSPATGPADHHRHRPHLASRKSWRAGRR